LKKTTGPIGKEKFCKKFATERRLSGEISVIDISASTDYSGARRFRHLKSLDELDCKEPSVPEESTEKRAAIEKKHKTRTRHRKPWPVNLEKNSQCDVSADRYTTFSQGTDEKGVGELGGGKLLVRRSYGVKGEESRRMRKRERCMVGEKEG